MPRDPSPNVKTFKEFPPLMESRQRAARVRVVSYSPDFDRKLFDIRWYIFQEGWDRERAIVLDIEGVDKLMDILAKAKMEMLKEEAA